MTYFYFILNKNRLGAIIYGLLFKCFKWRSRYDERRNVWHGILWWILIAVVIIGAIYILKNRTNQQRETSHSPYQPTHSSAFDVLDEEFAKGNLTEEEYLHKKEVLKK